MKKTDIYSGNLILVNGEFPIHSDGAEDLVCVMPAFPEIRLRREAKNALQALLHETGSGGQIVPVSGYRSREAQTEIYESSLRDNGEDFTRKFVALPGHSEHQTGLAIDLGLNQEVIDFIRPDFPYDGICGAFRKLAPKYGFVERYPRGKETVTGIAHEPWHFRYVGCPHAEIMTAGGLTLEEYIACLKHFRGYGKCLRWSNACEVFYGSEEADLELPAGCRYEISGNNGDGFIVTLWRDEDGTRA